MRKQLILLFLLVYTVFVYAQVNVGQEIKSKVIDSKTGESLIYANVYNINAQRGTLTDHNGFFKLPEYTFGDSIKISYIGYYDTIIIAHPNQTEKITLKPKVELLKEVLVYADDDYLYDLLAKIRRNYLFSNAIERSSKFRTAKTYYQLETFFENQRTELLEAYYNGNFLPYDINEFHIKKGRAGIKAVDSNLFITSETSKTFYLHKLFYQSDHFPINPVQLGKRKLKKYYALELVNAFKAEKSKVLQIDFYPKTSTNNYFSGTIWVDASKQHIKKIKLNAVHTNRHPFLAFGNIEAIRHVDMFITKTFQIIDNESYVKSIDFNYNLQCRYSGDTIRNYGSRAIIKAYNYDAQFNLPLFSFSKSLHQDYRDISALPHDTAFWEQTRTFAMHMNSEKKQKFIKENSIQIKRSPLKTISPKSSIYDFFYRSWQKERLTFSGIQKATPEHLIIVKKNGLEDPITNYYLNTKLYLDFNLEHDSVWFSSKALLDPVGTFDDHEMNNQTRAFINMYFDLLEIKRRELVNDLKKITQPNPDKIRQLYEEHLNAYKQTIKKFTHDVHHGQTYEGMRLWNKIIMEELDVNNIKKYLLYESLEKETIK